LALEAVGVAAVPLIILRTANRVKVLEPEPGIGGGGGGAAKDTDADADA
jgi:hypothetical protein